MTTTSTHTKRVLFVGMNPAAERRPTVPRYCALGRLYEWATALGIPYFSFVNCSHRYGTFVRSTVDTDFLRMVVSQHDGPVVALGEVASRILRRVGVSHHAMPHPSYRNRKLNDREYEKRMLEEARTLLT